MAGPRPEDQDLPLRRDSGSAQPENRRLRWLCHMSTSLLLPAKTDPHIHTCRKQPLNSPHLPTTIKIWGIFA